MIIRKNPNASGAYPAPQSWRQASPPDGYAVIADTVDMAEFFAYNGFVTLTIEAVEHTRQVMKFHDVNHITIGENGDEIVETHEEPYYEDEPYTIDTVTAYTPNTEAWEAWKASLPAPEPVQPSEEEDTAAMLVDHEYRLTMLELGLTEY